MRGVGYCAYIVYPAVWPALSVMVAVLGYEGVGNCAYIVWPALSVMVPVLVLGYGSEDCWTVFEIHGT